MEFEFIRTWKLFAGLSFNALESKWHKVDGQSKGLTECRDLIGTEIATIYPFYTLMAPTPIFI